MKAVLFDLDGTLLNTQFDELLQEYFTRISNFFRPYMEPKLFMKELLAATETMISDTDGSKTNLEVFLEHFCSAADLNQDAMPLFDRFYAEEFPKLKPANAVNPSAREVLDLAAANGYKIVVATNPVFPQQAIIERLRWAELADTAFDLVTHGENMHYCKPQPDYYQEIADYLAVSPQDCLMIGDDPENDGAAALVGMQVWLLTEGRTLCDAKPLLADNG